MNVRNELQHLAQDLFIPNVDETSQNFLQSLLVRVNEISDEQWALLTQATRNWINEAIECVKVGTDIICIPVVEPIVRSTASLHLLADDSSVTVNEEKILDIVPIADNEITEIIEIPQIKEMEAKECKPNNYYEVSINGIPTKVVCIRNTDKPLIEDDKGKRYLVPNNMKVKELLDSPRGVNPEKGIKVIKEKGVKEKAPKKMSVSKFIRILLFKNPEISKENVVEAVTKEGLSCSEATLKYELNYFYSTVEILKELGMWKQYEQNNK